jgi:hypothetical protein
MEISTGWGGLGGRGGGGLHSGQFRDQKSKYIKSYVLKCLEQDLCRKCAKNIEKIPPKHGCARVVK